MTDPTTPPVLPGAEPFSATGDRRGVLVLHGFTGSPQSMRGLAEAFAAAGCTVELPLLPGHGTSVDDMLGTDFGDWSAAVEAAYTDLAARTDGVVVAGLSMGGTLALWLATHHPELAGLVLVNPAVVAPDPALVDGLREMLAQGADRFPAIGNDVADPDQVELAYDETPIAPLLSMVDALAPIEAELGKVVIPVLLCTSPQDHVVDPVSSETLAAAVAGPVERFTCERSFHVATLDFDHEEIERRAVAFAAERLG